MIAGLIRVVFDVTIATKVLVRYYYCSPPELVTITFKEVRSGLTIVNTDNEL